MPETSYVIRQPQNTLVVFPGPPATAYKLSQRDVVRVELRADTPIDYLSENDLIEAMQGLGIQDLILDSADRATIATATGIQIPDPEAVAPPPGPVPPFPRRETFDPVDDDSGASRLRAGLIVAVVVLGAILLVILFGIMRLFSGPDTAGRGTPTAAVTTTMTVTGTPSGPTVTAIANTPVYAGPGAQYATIGLLPAGASAAVLGRTLNNDWWLVSAPGAPGDQGWVPASSVNAANVGSVPVVTPSPQPAATPTPTVPTTFPDWKGEYFDNPDVAGQPVFLRNDPAISFNWGSGSPAPGLPSNDYSVRWSRKQFFEQGNFVFNANVEGGVRLWLDGRMLIDSWQGGPLRLEQAESGPIDRGDHDLRVDYRKTTGAGQIAVSWQGKAAQPPVAVITAPPTGQVGQPVLFSSRQSTAAVGQRITAVQWQFGDGAGSTDAEVNKVYDGAGIYNVTLAVTDDAGLTSTASQQIAISPAPQPPVAVIRAPAEGMVGQPVPFDGSASMGASPIVSYQWNFGDGGTADAVRIDHVYARAGVYNVSLNVVDSQNMSNTSTVQVQIDAPPTPTPTPISAPTATPTPQATAAPPPLEGTLWRLQNTLQDTEITATFQEGELRGSGGCNTYSGPYTLDGQTIAVGPLELTNQACPQPVMDQETQYLAALEAAQSYQIQGNQLTINSVAADQPVALFYTAAQ